MFSTLPKVFATLGAGRALGGRFFALSSYAALTRRFRNLMSGVASFCDLLHIQRKAATFFTGAINPVPLDVLGAGVRTMRGRPASSGGTSLASKSWTSSIFITNSVLSAINAAATCIFIAGC